MEGNLLSKFQKFLKKDNNLQLAIVAVAVVALVVFLVTTTLDSGGNANANDATGTSASANSGEESLETRLERILSSVDGAGAVKVLVTYETGPEIVPALKSDTQNNTSDSSGTGQRTTSTTENNEPVVVQGKNGTEPLVLVKKEPVILGVLVVAEGASDLDVRIRLSGAVQVALQIAPDRIEVLPMNITNLEEGK